MAEDNDILLEKETEKIRVYGARVHNLKNIDVEIPRNNLCVITGLSGSGKSSLAFDTIYAEGQRRYIETFSAYARNFLGNMERPDVDKITGLSPVISIDQKTTNKNPRSTVGTITEVYDFMRLLFARAGVAYSYLSGEQMVRHTEEQITRLIQNDYAGKRIYLLAPLVRSRRGHYRELFEDLRKKGYLSVRIDGTIQEMTAGMKLDRYQLHDVELVVDKMVVEDTDRQRLEQSISTALSRGNGLMMILDGESGAARYYSKQLMCPVTGLSYRDPHPYSFSFNSAQGACPKCKGIGTVTLLNIDKAIPDRSLSIRQGGILPLMEKQSGIDLYPLFALLEKYGLNLDTPVKDIPDEVMNQVLYGADEALPHPASLEPGHKNMEFWTRHRGIEKYLLTLLEREDVPPTRQQWAEQFLSTQVCPECHGARLCKESLQFRIADKNIHELSSMDLRSLYDWVCHVEERLSPRQARIASEILKEIRVRLEFLLDVGLDYLSLARSSTTLSGGESQRIRLATQIGSQLVNVLYILDEPSIGLHQRDNLRLINALKSLRDEGNSVMVVEHDKDMMLHADYVVDLGPKAGRLGGEVVFAGTPQEMLRTPTLTSRYLTGELRIEVPKVRRTGSGKSIWLRGARGNNLRGVDVEFPLGRFICVTGVSGSGKSSLISDTLQPILSAHFYRSQCEPLPYGSIEGIEFIDKIVDVDQSPLGRSPRSNPATYTGVFSDIRSLFVGLPEAKIRGYKPGRFSFNVAGGRCETCGGNGYKTIEMNFLPDVMVPCETCHGKRYNRETLEVRFKGKSIADILDMTINRAVEFFANIPAILNKIKVLQDVGLGYVTLGQPSTTLSGGESQRVKLATELSKRDTGKTLYILDEPTTGLHFEDIRALLGVLNRLVDKGNTVIVIEHNLDVIKVADYVIDMGPEGGKEGGMILSCGTPEEVARSEKGYTPQFLRKELGWPEERS